MAAWHELGDDVVKIMWLLKRKPGLTAEQFREHYERSHVPMAQKHIGHLLLEYRRNYKVETAGGPYFENGGFAAFDWDYDVITEFVLKSNADVSEMFRVFSDPLVGQEFYEDELNFMDRDRTIMYRCEVVDTSPSDGTAQVACALAR